MTKYDTLRGTEYGFERNKMIILKGEGVRGLEDGTKVSMTLWRPSRVDEGDPYYSINAMPISKEKGDELRKILEPYVIWPIANYDNSSVIFI